MAVNKAIGGSPKKFTGGKTKPEIGIRLIGTGGPKELNYAELLVEIPNNKS